MNTMLSPREQRTAEITNQIERFLVAGECNTHAIAQEIGLADNSTLERLRKLEDHGRIKHRLQLNDKGGRFFMWSLEDGVVPSTDGPLRRSFVPAYDMHGTRDPLVAALFGPAAKVASC